MALTAEGTRFILALRGIGTADKVVRNRFLNRLGCQVGRALLAEALLRLRRRRYKRAPTRIDADLIRDGVAIIPEFVPGSVFSDLVEELHRGEAQFFKDRGEADKFGIVRNKIKVSRYPELFPISHRVTLENVSLLQIARVAEGWSDEDDFAGNTAILTYEKLEQATEPGPVNSLRNAEVSSGDLHADTFHYVTKAFLTLNDVTLASGPYTYAVGSQRLGIQRLLWEYRASLRSEQYETSQYHNRVSKDEQATLRLQPRPFLVKSNTLIVTNTFGFHLRGVMTRKGAIRRMLRLDFRSNPFRI